jgi:hypothetical protein
MRKVSNTVYTKLLKLILLQISALTLIYIFFSGIARVALTVLEAAAKAQNSLTNARGR